MLQDLVMTLTPSLVWGRLLQLVQHLATLMVQLLVATLEFGTLLGVSRVVVE